MFFNDSTPARMRIDGGRYRRDHLRALAQRVEVADRKVRIMGSKIVVLPANRY
jgi:site-specific DNA recombinase